MRYVQFEPKELTMFNEEEVRIAVKNSNSLRQTLCKLGITVGGNNSKLLREFIAKSEIEICHFKFINTRKVGEKLPDDEYFTKNTIRNGSHTKKRLILDHNFIEECDECGLGTEWNGKPISLQVDHIDGDHHNNEVINLRFLCPNCHSQCETFGTKRNKGMKRVYKCECGKKITTKASKCSICANSTRASKCPPKEELERLIWEIPTTKIAKRFGVSDKAVEKWCKKHFINKPSPGYWMKNK